MLVLTSFAAAAACRARAEDPKPLSACRATPTGITKTTFHGSTARLGWVSGEPDLAPSRVARGMSALWTSAPFDTFDLNGTSYPGRAYASPLYADGIRITKGAAAGSPLSVVFVATSNGDVIALSAFDAACAEGPLAAGTVLWKTRLVVPDVPPKLDGRDKGDRPIPAIAVGTVSTPVLDLAAPSPILYVSAMDAGPPGGLPVWKAFALDVASGAVVPGWPVVLDRNAVEAKNTNAPAYFDEDARIVSQRSALALSPEGDRLYLGFGGYFDGAVGWLVAIDTRTPRISASFSGASDTLLDASGHLDRHANAGMWAPGGPAIDERGRVYVTTGNSPATDGTKIEPHAWGNSMLRLDRDLLLEAAYTPYDYCELDRRDVDIAGSSAMLLPSLDPSTTTPNLLAFGGKGGVVYLLDRDRLAPATAQRPPCAARWDDAASDTSLLGPEPAEPYCAGFGVFGRDVCQAPIASTPCVKGPLQVFGPAGDDASVDRAKMRTTPAFFRAADGTSYVYVAGTTKARRCVVDAVPPSLVRLRVVTGAGKPAHLARDAADEELRFINPGSPVVSSDGGQSPVVWVVDQNARRTDALLDPDVPGPVLYAVDALTMKLLWKTSPTELEKGGKYVTPLVAHGTVFVATDRLHAFRAVP
jgi:outer membrane protein assembly factor BamB